MNLTSAYSIFQQPWWLEAVAPGSWGEVIIEKGGQIYARLPYVIKRKYGLKVMDMPPLTLHLGPWLRAFPGKYANRISEEHQLMAELIENLPSFDVFQQNFHFSITNWLPFYWKGFQQTTHYTYRINNLSDISLIWESFRENIRRDIRKAESRFNLRIRTDLPVDAFIPLNIQTFERQGRNLPYPESLIRRLDAACVEHNARKIFIAEDKLGRHHAGVYIVWDEQSAYYLMGGGHPTLRSSGATSLCMWEAIQFAATVTKSFDFEGSIIEPIERFFRSFGAQQTPYFQVVKINSLPLRVYYDLRSWLRYLK
jgi:hypothetical protein